MASKAAAVAGLCASAETTDADVDVAGGNGITDGNLYLSLAADVVQSISAQASTVDPYPSVVLLSVGSADFALAPDQLDSHSPSVGSWGICCGGLFNCRHVHVRVTIRVCTSFRCVNVTVFMQG